MFQAVKTALIDNKIPIASSEITMLPKSTIPIEGAAVAQMLRLMDALEDNDDVQNVYANFDIQDQQ